MSRSDTLERIVRLADALREAGAFLSGEAAAHAHAAAASGSVPGAPPRYPGLAPLRIEAVFTRDEEAPPDVAPDRGPVAAVVRDRLDLFTTSVEIAGASIPVVTREAAMAELLDRGGLALGLAATLLTFGAPVDADDVREILKAARRGERFQPLLELLQIV